MNRITVDLDQVLELIFNAEDFGYDKPEFYNDIFQLFNKLTEKQIHDFANTYEDDQDIDLVVERLTDLNNKYGVDCNLEELANAIEDTFDDKDDPNEPKFKDKD